MGSIERTNWHLVSTMLVAMLAISPPAVIAQEVTIENLKKDWLKYEQQLSEQTLSGVRHREGGPADANWNFLAGREEEQFTFAQRNGHWIKKAELGSPRKSYVEARNPLYRFRVESSPAVETVSDSWTLKEVTPNILPGRLAQDKIVSEINPLFLDHRSSLLDLVELPYFELVSIHPTTAPDTSGECLELTFKTPHPHVAGGVLIQSGKVVLQKKQGWLPIRFEIRQNIGAGEAEVQIDFIGKIEYSTDQLGIPLPTLFHDKMTATRKGAPPMLALRVRTIEWNAKTDSSFIKECRLSHYGLPEPPAIRAAQWNWGTWLLLVFGVAIVAIVAIYFWRRSKFS